MRSIYGAAVLALGLGHAPARSEPMAATVVNHSGPTLCAEDDNVDLRFENPKIGGFVIEARPPAALGTIVADRTAPDFTDCAIVDAPPKADPGPDARIVLHEDDFAMLVGYRHAGFWRKAEAVLRVGDRREAGLHLVQLFLKTPAGPYEYLVLYPQDGYWRARPLPPARFPQTAYGTSFLIGPIEEDKRPLAALKEISFDPANRAFDLIFARGGKGRLRVASITQDAAILDVTLEPGVAGRPFVVLRSMFVTETNADGALAGWLEQSAKAWRVAPVMEFKAAAVTQFQLFRAVVSRHNSSAPDIALRAFRGVGPGP